MINLLLDNKSISVNKEHSLLDLIQNSDVAGFHDENGKILNLDESVTNFTSIFSITRTQFAANLIHAFSSFMNLELLSYELKADLSDSDISVRRCIVKFYTDLTFSINDFEEYKKRIKNASFENNSVSPIIANEVSKYHNLLPFDFDIDSVAQEEQNGRKIQKFGIVIYYTEADKEAYFQNLDFLKRNDHRYIGKQLEYFMMIPEAPGAVFWLPKGWSLFKNLVKFIRKHAYYGFNEVNTPCVMSNSFWKKSGHLVSFKQNMMFVNMGESSCEDSALKPMNCPSHIQIFDRKVRSYRDLPLRIAEFGSCHRYEPSGALNGLMRVRAFTQDDGHVFCSLDHVKSETERFLKDCKYIYTKLGFENVQVILATKPENALGNADEWDLAEKYLSDSLKSVGLPFTIAEGEGAFYGPKVELHVKDSLDRSWQLGTIQLDFVLPQRFEISYVKDDGQKGKVCMLHRAILGSLERFIGVLLEHSEGKVPIFLAPVQIAVCSVVDESNEYAQKVHDLLTQHEIASTLDIRNQTLVYKIRDHKTAKVPAIAVIGKQEMKDESITIEYLDQKLIFKLDEIEKITRLFNEN